LALEGGELIAGKSMSQLFRPSPRAHSGCLTALMIGFGVVLLLPGVCAFLFITAGRVDNLVSLAVTIPVVGLALIAVGAYYEYGRNKARDEVEAPRGLTAGARTAVMVVGVILAVGAALWMIASALLHGLR
jgi:hypothetical protein